MFLLSVSAALMFYKEYCSIEAAILYTILPAFERVSGGFLLHDTGLWDITNKKDAVIGKKVDAENGHPQKRKAGGRVAVPVCTQKLCRQMRGE